MCFILSQKCYNGKHERYKNVFSEGAVPFEARFSDGGKCSVDARDCVVFGVDIPIDNCNDEELGIDGKVDGGKEGVGAGASGSGNGRIGE